MRAPQRVIWWRVFVVVPSWAGDFLVRVCWCCFGVVASYCSLIRGAVRSVIWCRVVFVGGASRGGDLPSSPLSSSIQHTLTFLFGRRSVLTNASVREKEAGDSLFRRHVISRCVLNLFSTGDAFLYLFCLLLVDFIQLQKLIWGFK